jgi:hypothetical protein
MAYIIKNTSGLINTRLTDVGRRKLSQGNFNISYFQIGDSEVSYKAVPNYNQTNNNILMPDFNAQNDTGSPQSNKENIKYPYYVEGNRGNTYGLPFMDSTYQEVYNSAGEKGFFVTGGTSGSWSAQTSSAYTITSNYIVQLDSLSGQTFLDVEFDGSSPVPTTGTPSVGDLVTLIIGEGSLGGVQNFPVLTYKIQGLNPTTGTSATTYWTFTLDRAVPDFTSFNVSGQISRVLVYPSGMTVLYDFVTPAPFWQTDTINFESPCDVVNRENTLIWNMNIPWSESPAGVFSATYEDYTKYGSVTYIGTKEYLGYQESSGQTDTSQVYYYNSFDEKIVVKPEEQKAIAIIHYTNQDIDHVYGEKFSTVPFDPQNPTNQIGLARHLKVTIPTLMWHKSTGNTIGQSFFIDPPGYDLCKPYYIKSTKNLDMNDPGIRYYHLWDTNPDDNGNLNRIGKVFPDSETIVIDDEEVVAAMSYKSNRNWTLPAPKLSYLAPNTIYTNNSTATGLLTADTQTLWVTYRLNTTAFTESLHCNYYSKIVGPSSGCSDTSQNVAVRFGPEFQFLNQPSASTTVSGLTGYCASSLMLLCQITSGDTKPSPTNWKHIDVTPYISATTVNGYLTMSGLTGTTFQIDLASYQDAVDNGDIYNLADYINIPTNNQTTYLNFGDEYYFYGNFTTDISATIYEMRYLINLGRNQFTNTSNPTWTSGTTSYVTEIGLYDSNKDLIVISKLQSPELRQGIQQYVVKLDF